MIMINVCRILTHAKRDVSPVKLTVCYMGKYYNYFPSISVPLKYWNKDKKVCRVSREFPDASYINSALQNHERLMIDAFRHFEKEQTIPSVEMIREWIADRISQISVSNSGLPVKKVIEKTGYFIDFAEKYKDSCDRKLGTKKSYGSTISCLKRFEIENGKTLTFSDIDISFYKLLRSYLIENNYSKNYIGTIVKNIMHFMEEAKTEGLHNSDTYRPKGVKAESETADTIYLNEEEIKRIHDIAIDEKLVIGLLGKVKGEKRNGRDQSAGNIRRKVESMNLERDRFLIGYCTALRISDYSRIDTLNIQDGIISIWTKKKDKKVFIPIHWMLREVINKYGGLNLPPISDQRHNDQIKDICKAAGITDTTMVTITKGGERKEIVKQKCDLVSSHTARRSGATNMYKAGIPLHYIQQILGHSKIDTTIKYLKVTSEETARSLQEHRFFSGK